MNHLKIHRSYKPRVPKAVRKILLSAFILMFIALLAGTAYVFFGGDNPDQQTTKTAISESPKAPTIIKPRPPGSNARVGVAVTFIQSPVQAGSNSALSISTSGGANCTILVTYNNGVTSKDSGLSQKTADAYGQLSWTWTVEKTVPPGKYQVKATCAIGKQSGMVIADLEVTK